MMQEINSELKVVLKDRMDIQHTSFISIEVKSIKKLVLRFDAVVGGKKNIVYFDISLPFPPQ